jgi:hypothetical protein
MRLVRSFSPGRHRATGWSPLALVVQALLWASGASGQVIEGRVVDGTLGTAVPQATVELVRDQIVIARGTTDGTGAFRLEASRSGPHAVRASALGFLPVESEAFEVGQLEVVEITIRISRSPIALDGITVEGRRRDLRHSATYDGLYARREAAHTVGSARVVVRGDLELENAMRVSDVLRHFPPARGCVDYYVNGEPRPELLWGILEMPTDFLEGIEYYQDGLFAPFDYYGGDCAFRAIRYSIIAIWYRLPES